MASELSREEMEYVIGQAKETASDWVIEHLNKVSDTDAALRQQLEQAQQLVTDGQEAIGHWQGEVYHVRQLLVDEKAIADHNLTDWHEAEHKIEQLRQRVRELEADRSIQMNGARTLARFVLNHLPEQHTTHGDGELFDCATAILESAVPHTTPWLIQMMEVARVDKSDLPQHLYQANQQLAAAQAKIITLTDALESGFMKGAYARLSELQHKEQTLYEAEARILELEQALRLQLAVAVDDPILLTWPKPKVQGG